MLGHSQQDETPILVPGFEWLAKDQHQDRFFVCRRPAWCVLFALGVFCSRQHTRSNAPVPCEMDRQSHPLPTSQMDRHGRVVSRTVFHVWILSSSSPRRTSGTQRILSTPSLCPGLTSWSRAESIVCSAKIAPGYFYHSIYHVLLYRSCLIMYGIFSLRSPVQGVVHHINQAELAKLDVSEGPLYHRVQMKLDSQRGTGRCWDRSWC